MGNGPANSILRGFGIAVSAARGWRSNPLLPFVVRGLAGERHRLKFGLLLLGTILAYPVGRSLSFWLAALVTPLIKTPYGKMSPFAFFLLTTYPGWLLLSPFQPSFLIPVAAGIAARRWMRSGVFLHELRTVAGAAAMLAELLVALVSLSALACHLSTRLVHAACYVLGIYNAGQAPAVVQAAESMYVKARAIAALQGVAAGPAGISVGTEIVARCAAAATVVALACCCLALVAMARSLAVGIGASYLLHVASALASALTVRHSRLWLAESVAPLFTDLVARPALALAWACAACWTIALLRDRLDARLGPQ